jgi:hypothetical protein
MAVARLSLKELMLLVMLTEMTFRQRVNPILERNTRLGINNFNPEVNLQAGIPPEGIKMPQLLALGIHGDPSCPSCCNLLSG